MGEPIVLVKRTIFDIYLPTDLMKVKVFLIIATLLTSSLHGLAQNFFLNFPKNLQFYQRDSTGVTQLNISGSVETNAYKAIKLVVKQNGLPFFENRIDLTNANVFSWEFNLLAGLFEYDFEIRGFLSNDSTSIAKASKVLCGDTYLIYGQSNAAAICCYEFIRTTYNHKYLRNFVYDHQNPTGSNNGWHDINIEFGWPGAMGTWLAKNIIDEQKIPIQIINGAVGGESLALLVARDSENPENPETFYGRFLKRIEGSKVPNFKGLIFSQGEWESNTGDSTISDSYANLFKSLLDNLVLDGALIEHLYLIQTNIPNDFTAELSAAKLRDEQRKLKSLFPNLNMYSGFDRELSTDGLHYTHNGYISLANDLYLGIRNHIYGGTERNSITGPLVQKVIHNREDKHIRVVFDANQELKVQNIKDFGYYQRRLKDYIYDSQQRPFIDSAGASANEVTLFYSGNFEGNKLTYLPSYFKDNFSINYNGPLIQNRNNLPALSFLNVYVCEEFPRPIIDTFMLQNEGVAMILNGSSCSGCNYEIYGKALADTTYKFLSMQSSDEDTVSVDLSWSGNKKNISIRIKLVSEQCESDFSQFDFDKCPEIRIYQNLPFSVKEIKGDSLIYSAQRNGQELSLKFEKFIELLPGFQSQGPFPFLAEIGRCVNN